ncbi:MAG: RNA polymerase sigma factor [Gemmataceae bacterium]|nr:RNA polymerase sigma factor [Gemmataceae bacterium]
MKEHNPVTSPTLLGRLRQTPGDPAAWTEFTHRYGSMIYRWCCYWGLQEADAQDVVQNVLLELSREMREFTYDSTGSFRSWLKTVARRAWIRYQESQRRHHTSGDAASFLEKLRDPKAQEDLLRHLEEEYERELLERALLQVQLRVKSNTFEAFRLTVFEGLSGREAAERIGMPVSHVFVAKSNVQKMVREVIAELDCEAIP